MEQASNARGWATEAPISTDRISARSCATVGLKAATNSMFEWRRGGLALQLADIPLSLRAGILSS